MPFNLARSSAANESYNDALVDDIGDMGLTGECSSLHSDSRVLVPVSLPNDESNRLIGADGGNGRSSFRGNDFSFDIDLMEAFVVCVNGGAVN